MSISTITIDRLGARGDGVGRAEGGEDDIFAPLTLPGERATGTITDGRIEGAKITLPSPHRALPPCPQFDTCGGCALQHATDPYLADWKRERVREALSARGIEGVEIAATLTSPPASRRRATFAARRTKKTVLAGFHGARSGTLVPIEGCTLIEPGLHPALAALADAARLGGSRKGEIRGRATLTESGIDLAIEGGKTLDDSAFAGLAALAEAHDLARLTWNEDFEVTRRPPTLPMGRARVPLPPGGFLQATAHGQNALIDAVRRAIGPKAGRIVDLFSGAGTFALPLAEQAEVHAVEADAPALAALDTGWRGATGLKAVTTEVRDLFRRPLVPLDLRPYDAAVIDPPRAGAAAQMTELAAGGPPLIAAVSCEPATFARDARTLIDGGYTLDWIQPVDQFRWSPHVELVARFSRR